MKLKYMCIVMKFPITTPLQNLTYDTKSELDFTLHLPSNTNGAVQCYTLLLSLAGQLVEMGPGENMLDKRHTNIDIYEVNSMLDIPANTSHNNTRIGQGKNNI
jgi:hypothetical protein